MTDKRSGTPPGQTPGDEKPHDVTGTPDDAKHYVKCISCGAWIDTRNTLQCLDHEGLHELSPDLRQH
jgi:hypothetical protein